mmetsp:Transcript_8940/g.14646  ORF Transcript_8940/g.14646 Transcript_8940/m.14646 type:complete len:817 (+) Transcript_8940:104-2554(+)
MVASLDRTRNLRRPLSVSVASDVGDSIEESYLYDVSESDPIEESDLYECREALDIINEMALASKVEVMANIETIVSPSVRIRNLSPIAENIPPTDAFGISPAKTDSPAKSRRSSNSSCTTSPLKSDSPQKADSPPLNDVSSVDAAFPLKELSNTTSIAPRRLSEELHTVLPPLIPSNRRISSPLQNPPSPSRSSPALTRSLRLSIGTPPPNSSPPSPSSSPLKTPSLVRTSSTSKIVTSGAYAPPSRAHVGLMSPATRRSLFGTSPGVVIASPASSRSESAATSPRSLPNMTPREVAVTSLESIPLDGLIQWSLDLKGKNLTDKDFEHFRLSADLTVMLSTIDLSSNQLTTMPHMLSLASGVSSLNLSDNCMTGCPDLSCMPSLRHIDLSLNAITNLHPSVLSLPLLETLRLRGNPFGREVPGWVAELDTLGEVELGVLRKTIRRSSIEGQAQQCTKETESRCSSRAYLHFEDVSVGTTPRIGVDATCGTDEHLEYDAAQHQVSMLQQLYGTSSLEALQTVASQTSPRGVVLPFVIPLPLAHEMESQTTPRIDLPYPCTSALSPRPIHSTTTEKKTGVLCNMSEPIIPAPYGGNVCIVALMGHGFERLWGSEPDGMTAAVGVLNDIVSSTAANWHAYYFKADTSSALFAFASAVNAIRWCIAVQEALVTADWPASVLKQDEAALKLEQGQIVFRGLRVKMGVAAGETVCHPSMIPMRMEYTGQPVDEAERLTRLADGGQVLLNSAAYTSFFSMTESIKSVDVFFVCDDGPTGDSSLVTALPRSLRWRKFRSKRARNFAYVMSLPLWKWPILLCGRD